MNKESIIIRGKIITEKGEEEYSIFNLDKNANVYVDAKRFNSGISDIKNRYYIVADNRYETIIDFNNTKAYTRSSFNSMILLDKYQIKTSHNESIIIEKALNSYCGIEYKNSYHYNAYTKSCDRTEEVMDELKILALNNLEIKLQGTYVESIGIKINTNIRKLIVPEYVSDIYLYGFVDVLIIKRFVIIHNKTNYEKPVSNLIIEDGYDALSERAMTGTLSMCKSITIDASKIKKIRCKAVNCFKNEKLCLSQIGYINDAIHGRTMVKELTLGRNIRWIEEIGHSYRLETVTILGTDYFTAEKAFHNMDGLKEIKVRRDTSKKTLGRVEKARDNENKNIKISYIDMN